MGALRNFLWLRHDHLRRVERQYDEQLLLAFRALKPSVPEELHMWFDQVEQIWFPNGKCTGGSITIAYRYMRMFTSNHIMREHEIDWTELGFGSLPELHAALEKLRPTWEDKIWLRHRPFTEGRAEFLHVTLEFT